MKQGGSIFVFEKRSETWKQRGQNKALPFSYGKTIPRDNVHARRAVPLRGVVELAVSISCIEPSGMPSEHQSARHRGVRPPARGARGAPRPPLPGGLATHSRPEKRGKREKPRGIVSLCANPLEDPGCPGAPKQGSHLVEAWENPGTPSPPEGGWR